MAGFPMGTGHGLLSCPAGAGLFPGLHFKGAAVAAAAAGGGGAKGVTAALGAPSPAAPAGLGSAGPMAAKGLATSGSLFGCKGLSLGLGIGLGFWGPLVLTGLGVAAAFTLWKSRQAHAALSDDEQEFQDSLAER